MADDISTHDWHLVAGITYDDVNSAIAANSSAPSSMQKTSSDGTAVMNANCGDWTLTTGGAGGVLMLNIPMTGGTMVVNGTSFPITPATTVFTVHAQYLPQPGQQNLQNLVVNVTGTQQQPAATASTPMPAQANFWSQAALDQLLNEWVAEHLDTFNHVFAVVDIEADFGKYDALSWMRPWHLGYAVEEPSTNPTTANSVFAVMALVDEPKSQAEKDQMISKLAYEVDLGVIPSDKKAGLVVSSEKFLKHMILAAVPFMFGNPGNAPDVSDFQIDNDGKRIISTKGLDMQEVSLENGDMVKPHVPSGEFQVQVNGQELQIISNQMTFEYSPGITVKLNYTGSSTMSMDQTDKSLKMTVARQKTGGSVETSKALDILQIALGITSILTAIVGGVGGAVAKSANAAVTSATTAALDGVEAVAESEAVAAQATLSICRGAITGTVEEIGTLGSRLVVLAKVAGFATFAMGTTAGIISIMKGLAAGKSKENIKITEFTDAALDKAIKFPNTPSYELTEAYLQGSLVFGLDHVNSGGS